MIKHFFYCAIAVLFACQSAEKNTAENEKLKVVCTTGMIADAAAQIGGQYIEVQSLMGPGVDPHLYKASQGDLRLLSDADIIFYNGIHLEGKMGGIFKKLGLKKPVVAIGDALDKEQLIRLDGISYDPHIWMDVPLWSKAIEEIRNTLVQALPKQKKNIEKQFEAYQAQLTALDGWIRMKVEEIPAAKRMLITSHDAFNYFGRAYAIQVIGLQGISTLSEFGLKDITNMVQTITENGIPYVFVESSVSTKSLEAVMVGCKDLGHDLQIGGTLYSDALGAADGLAGTYKGMMQHNVNTLVKALAKP